MGAQLEYQEIVDERVDEDRDYNDSHEVVHVDGREVVVKHGPPSDLVLAEAMALSQVDSQHIPKIVACYRDGDEYVLLREKVEGHPLTELIDFDEASWQSEGLEPREAGILMREICKPFLDLHNAGMLYRDLNLEHLILGSDHVSLVDFDSTMFADSKGQFVNNFFKGTWQTMAPEEFEEQSGATLSFATNVYNLGAVAYQLLTGRSPFVANSQDDKGACYQRHQEGLTEDYINLLPEGVRDVLAKALAPAQIDRYQTVKEFIEAFSQATGAEFGIEDAVRWLKNNPDSHQPRKQVTTRDGNRVWVEADGRLVERSVERERSEINQYLDFLKEERSEYFYYLQGLMAEATMRPMAEENRVSVNIPAYMESGGIYNLLEQYTGQVDNEGTQLGSDFYEINIIINRPNGELADRTVAEIERFIAAEEEQGRSWTINYIDVQFPSEKANVGYARRVLTDLTLMRSASRDSQKFPLYIESEDADLVRVDKQTVVNLLHVMDQNPHLDIVSGIHDRDPETMKQNDFLFLSRRMANYVELLMQRKELRPEVNPNWDYAFSRIYTVGWNVGYSAEAYALVRGYSPQPLAEDLRLGEQMTMARGDGEKPNLDTVGRVSTRSDSSPRRFIIEVLRGQDAYDHGAFTDDEINKRIREESEEELMKDIESVSRINSSNTDVFEEMLRNFYERVRRASPNARVAQQLFSRALLFSGFKKQDYEYSDDGTTVTVSDWGNAAQALESYRARTER